jgi:hypothetical protein
VQLTAQLQHTLAVVVAVLLQELLEQVAWVEAVLVEQQPQLLVLLTQEVVEEVLMVALEMVVRQEAQALSSSAFQAHLLMRQA